MASAYSIAVSGMMSQQDSMAIIANNIANSATNGYKTNTMTFQESFVSFAGQSSNGNVTQFGNGARSAGIITDWSAGSIESTGTASNIALTGDGFFCVEYQGEVMYTRSGNFSLVAVDPTDPLTAYHFQLPNGATLLGGTAVDATTGTIVGPLGPVEFVGTIDPGPPIVQHSGAPTSYEISSDGTVTAKPSTIQVNNGFVGAQRFNNPDSLGRKEGGIYFATSQTAYNTVMPSVPGENGSGTVMQGSLEASNVDLVVEFTNMMITQRSFQANTKTITTADEMMQTVMNMKR